MWGLRRGAEDSVKGGWHFQKGDCIVPGQADAVTLDCGGVCESLQTAISFTVSIRE